MSSGVSKPGMSIDRAANAVNALYRPIVNDVEAPLQNGMSEQTMARFKAKQVVLDAGWRGQSSLPTTARTPLLLLFAVTGIRAADRVRQHRQPAAGARRGTRDARWRAAVARRESPPAHRPATRRIVPARAHRRHREPARRAVDAQRHFGVVAARRQRHAALHAAAGSAAVRGRRWPSAPGCCSACSRRCTARAPIWSRRFRASAGQLMGTQERRALPDVAGDGADRAVHDAARGRRACS